MLASGLSRLYGSSAAVSSGRCGTGLVVARAPSTLRVGAGARPDMATMASATAEAAAQREERRRRTADDG